MEQIVHIDGQAIGIDFVQKSWIKNTYLRFNDDKLVVVARNQRSMHKILTTHKDWIKKHYAQIKNNVRLFDNNSIFYRSKRYKVNYIRSESRPKADISEDVLTIYAANHEAAERLVDRIIKQDTERAVGEWATSKASMIGVQFKEIRARRYRKWGACKSDRSITVNYCLSMLPQHLQEYIVSHEVAHLKEMNHSGRFWGVVQKMCPDYKKHRKELRQYDSKRRNVIIAS